MGSSHVRDVKYADLVCKCEGERPLGRTKCRWEDNIKMGLSVQCVHLAHAGVDRHVRCGLHKRRDMPWAPRWLLAPEEGPRHELPADASSTTASALPIWCHFRTLRTV
jgi:hypothetical protein